jgi:hypothetical protein
MVRVKVRQEVGHTRVMGEIDQELRVSGRVPEMGKELSSDFHDAMSSFRKTPMQGRLR